MSYIFNEFLYKPLFNLLIAIVNIVPGNDLGFAIIILTILIKFALYPLSQKSIKSQKALQDLQPKLDEIKKKYKDQKEEMSKAMLNLYKENKVNPLSSCLPLLIQLPFLWAIFRVFSNGLKGDPGALLYSFVPDPGALNSTFLWIFDLSNPSWILALLAGLAQFWQTRMMSVDRPAIKSPGSKDEDMTAILNKQMMYIAPIFTVFIGLRFPGGLTLYWLVNTLFTVFQQMFVFKKNKQEKQSSA